MEFVSYLESKHQKNQLDASWVSSEIGAQSFLMKLYDAMSEDQEKFYSYLEERSVEHNEKVKKGIIPKNEFSFTHYVRFIKDKISEKYSRDYVDCISIPYFLKVRVEDKNIFIHKCKVDPLTQSMVKITVKIEEVIKGEKKYKAGQIISILYENNWERTSYGFEKGNSYLVPVRIIDSKFSDIKGEMVCTLSDYNICYPIINDIIEIPNDIFGLGKTINWNHFRTQFTSKYMFGKEEGREKEDLKDF